MLKLFIALFILYSNRSFAGLTEAWFESQGIDCKTQSIELTEPFQANLNETIICNSFEPITKGELEKLISSSKDVRVDLETWIYLQNSSKLITEEAKRKISVYKSYQNQLKQPLSKDLERIKKNYNLLHALYKKKSLQDKAINACKKTSPTAVPLISSSDRFVSNYNCSEVNSPKYQEENTETNHQISNLEMLNPQFLHPHFQKEFKNNQHTNFITSYDSYLNQALTELETKVAKHTQIHSLEMNKENLENLLDSQNFLSEVTAFNYRPDNKFFYSNESNSVKKTGLKRAQCITQQKLIAHETDDILLGLGKDIALLVSPFAIQARINMFIRTVKFAKNLTKAKQTANTAIRASEVSLAMIEQGFSVEAQSECADLSITLSQEKTISDEQQEKISECRDLADAMVTNSTLALLGGGVAIKLTKYDLQSMRLDRIYAKGRKLANQTNSAIAATIVKQADIIQQQVSNMFPPQVLESVTIVGPIQPPKVSPLQPSKVSPPLLHNTRSNYADILRIQKRIAKFSCGKSEQCKMFFKSIKKGLIALTETKPQGHIEAELILKSIIRRKFFKLPNELKKIYKQCLTESPCTPNQFYALRELAKVKIPYEPHPHFYKQILEEAKIDGSPDHIKRSLSFYSINHKPSGDGKRLGELNELKKIKGGYIINGHKFPRNSQKDKETIDGFIMENKAFNLLEEMGYHFTVVPDSPQARRKMGVSGEYDHIFDLEKLPGNKAPDIIMEHQHLIDVYSPTKGVNLDNVDTIVKKIIEKADSRNRQTNRVVIYADDIEGNPEEISNKIRELIGGSEPDHLMEAFIIYKHNNKPNSVTVWP